MVAPHTRGRFKISRIIKKHKSGNRLIWHVVKDNPFQSYEYSRWSPVIWYRLFAHRVFKDIDKMIYLDSDTLVQKDLSELFDTDLTGYCIGAIRDIAPTEDKYHSVGLYVKDFSDKYLNKGVYYISGVLLLNLKEIEKNEHLFFETKIPLVYPDQDLLNVAMLGKIKTLPLKYNLAPGLLIPKTFSKKEADDIFHNGASISHCYSVKPYRKIGADKETVDIFEKHAAAIGMKPLDFIKLDKKYTKMYESPIPGVYIRGDEIILFSMRIKI